MRFLSFFQATIFIEFASSALNLESIAATGGVSKFIQSTTGQQVDSLISLTQMDLKKFEKLKNDVIPLARGNPAVPIRDFVHQCVCRIKTDIDPTMSPFQATMWCLTASQNERDLKLNVVLSDEAFSEFVVPLLLDMNKVTSSPQESFALSEHRATLHAQLPSSSTDGQAREASQLRLAENPEDWRRVVPRIKSGILEVGRDKVQNCDVVSVFFWKARRIRPHLLLGPIPPPSSFAGRMWELMESIPAPRRIAIMDTLIETRYRRLFPERLKSVIVGADEKFYAKYLLTSIFIPQSIVRFLDGYVRRSPHEDFTNIRSASDIVEFFTRKDPKYQYITPERILEWYHVLTRSDPLAFESYPGDDLPPSVPRLSFRVDTWRKELLIPRRDRLQSTGIECLWVLPPFEL